MTAEEQERVKQEVFDAVDKLFDDLSKEHGLEKRDTVAAWLLLDRETGKLIVGLEPL